MDAAQYVRRGIVWLTSLSSPLLVWAFLPYLRGRHNALCKCNAQRLAGICGRLDSEQDGSESGALLPLQPRTSTMETERDKGSKEAGEHQRERTYPMELDREAKE